MDKTDKNIGCESSGMNVCKVRKIGVDIDCVLSMTDAKLDQLGFRRKREDDYHYEGIDEKFFLEHPEFYSDLEEVPGSKKGIWNIHRKHDIIYITHRHENALDVTKRWFAEKGYPDCPIYFAKDKGKLARELGIDLAFDDSPYCAKSYKDNDIDCWILPKPYNAHLNGFKRFNWDSIAI